MKAYEAVLRHEPDTHNESGSGWYYSHYAFEAVDDAIAIEKALSIGRQLGDDCANRTRSLVGYSCLHSVDEVLRVDGTALVSIYDDGVYQSVSWGKDGREIRTKRVTDDALRALLLNPWEE